MKNLKPLLFTISVIFSVFLLGFQPPAFAQLVDSQFGDFPTNDFILENRDLVIEDINGLVRGRWDSGTGDIRVLDRDEDVVFFVESDSAETTLGKQGEDGDLIVTDAQGNSAIQLDGASGDVSARDIQLRDGGFARINMRATNPNSDVRMFIDARGDGTNQGQLGTLSNHDLVLFTNSQPRMVIENDGTICIGDC